MARSIHQNTTVGETRSIVDHPRSVLDHIRQSIRIEHNELRKSLQTVHSTEGISSSDSNIRSVLGNLKSVTLIDSQLELGLILLHSHSSLNNTALDKSRLTIENEVIISLERTDKFVRLSRSDETEVVSINGDGLITVFILLRKRPDKGLVSTRDRHQ